MADESCIVGETPKHRACDECRFRKIACSKEPGGCARCEREGILCHYSPQKPMGRPRKRRLVDLEDSQRPSVAVTVDVAVTDFATGVRTKATTGMTTGPTTMATTTVLTPTASATATVRGTATASLTAAAAPTASTTTASSSARAAGPVAGFDPPYDYLASGPADDGFDVAALCETVGPDQSKQFFGLYDWNGSSAGISFIDLLPDFTPESPNNLGGQGDPGSMALMQGLSSGSTMLELSSLDGCPSLGSPLNASACPGSAGFDGNNGLHCSNNSSSTCTSSDNLDNNHRDHCKNNTKKNHCKSSCMCTSHHNQSNALIQNQSACTPPARTPFYGHQNSNLVSTPPYHDDGSHAPHDHEHEPEHDHGLNRHVHSVNTPPHTACSSPKHAVMAAASPLSSSFVPSCMPSLNATPRCQNRCQGRHDHTAAPAPPTATLTAAPHLHAALSTPQSTPHSRPQCHTRSHMPFPSPSPSETCLAQHQSQPRHTSSKPPLPPPPGIPCTCLSSLFFALSSLAQLPAHIPSAIRTARDASRMAHRVINCPECYDVTIVDPSKRPPIQCFQNLMCLGSLVPAACNAYVSILKMVDIETDRARAEKRGLWFSLGELGGSRAAALLSADQGEFLRRCNDKYIPPDLWRTAIRRILRLDVHGAEGSGAQPDREMIHGGESNGLGPFAASTPCSQPDDAGEAEPHQPLKGVITLLDEKNRRRHAQIDNLITAGRMPENSPYLLFPGANRVVPPEARNCSHMLETARLALSNLSIA